MLSVSNLSITFDVNHVLDGFNLNLESGDIFALLGDSGSGKSSALRFIAGLEKAKDGSVVLDGKDLSMSGVHSVRPEQREIGMVFQDYALFPHMNVFQNISFGIDHLAKDEKSLKVTSLLELISLSGIEKKYPHQLSGGEQQRVSLARALANSPKLLLLDEPFSSLDKSHRDELIRDVRNILKKKSVTSILVTHDEKEAEVFADKIGKIEKKQLLVV
ncbi:ABC transporter ATP-binding protein [Candidatus Pseudothioglobus singularis]|jgi:iron(III) transport system ATP-binding protein|uniref:ABC transporter ATP-binding protein n=1 Tax=Candidatus Pseudothioglobus singularis TaxID=1427364 RepID=UPI0006B2DA7D|nr:ABC transporter ATP-binding protein [Candidatus Pseudothioglobus singularis]MDG1955815.1 ABC transporter ATP-binding protein [Candidatus Thioglobus sp.]ANQ66860.1 ABC transporter [Candidatus Pseudothioglobus singularis]MDA9031202.1 ABC transporter ATP-binding protein [Candidatus Pseudothioglobus singularis]MDB4822568.1 ABC transporter ATP-binding protein [Candidatus Pseudothioglobus singularis]MDC0469856.1 ABC transporter ATP-binding protein [Candidatus Pseudothioglobus singularis]|tara:strand:- start:4513 stop:5163 length:651 start_codon:yes stop_codon:yes gene_type:complete